MKLCEEDLKFLKEFAKKRRTQEKDGCCEPVFWMIQDCRDIFTDDGEYEMFFDDGEELYNTSDEFDEERLEELKEYIIDNVDMDSETIEELKKVNDNDSLLNFLYWHDVDINHRSYTKEYFISNMTGAFLTKEEAKNYLKDNYYHHSKSARTFGMVAWRNSEFKRLMEIIDKFAEEVEE